MPTRLVDAYKKWGVTSLSQRRFREAIGAFEKSLERHLAKKRGARHAAQIYGWGEDAA